MDKTDKTLDLERRLWFATNKTGVFGCFEVTIDLCARERLNYHEVRQVLRNYKGG